MASRPNFPESLATVPTLVNDLNRLGVQSGMTLIVHSSLKSMGYVNGGPVAVILALEEVLGVDGTLVMPTHTGENSNPANWINPPVPEAWWEIIRATAPAFVPALTPTYYMGIIPETFRKQHGVLRSDHPQTSFAAWGKHAVDVTARHALLSRLGERSPLARIYDLDGWVLLLGVGHENNTSLHLAEARARIPQKAIREGAAMMVDGQRQWVWLDDIDVDSSDFADIGADFVRQNGLQYEGKVAQATTLLVPQRALVDFGVGWLERHRGLVGG